MEQANNLSGFKKVLERYSDSDNILFRGQSANYKNITSSIARDKGYLENEFALYEESINIKKHEFVTLINPIQILAKSQYLV